MIPVRYVEYSFGKHRIFYVAENVEDPAFIPSVDCYCPIKDCKTSMTMEKLDVGIYYFEVDFKTQGNHLFVFYEDTKRTGILNAIVRPY